MPVAERRKDEIRARLIEAEQARSLLHERERAERSHVGLPNAVDSCRFSAEDMDKMYAFGGVARAFTSPETETLRAPQQFCHSGSSRENLIS